MNDEIFDRIYQSGRADLNDGIDRLLGRVSRSVSQAFNAAHRIHFDAPWAKRRQNTGCA